MSQERARARLERKRSGFRLRQCVIQWLLRRVSCSTQAQLPVSRCECISVLATISVLEKVCTIQTIKTIFQVARFRAPEHTQAWQLMPKVALSPVTVSVTDSNEVRCPRAAPATHPVGTDP